MQSDRTAFTAALLELDRRAKAEAGFTGNALTRMITRHKCGVIAAKEILRPRQGIHEGLVDLWVLGRVDLSVEALVVQKRWHHLFRQDELREAHRRLRACEYTVREAA